MNQHLLREASDAALYREQRDELAAALRKIVDGDKDTYGEWHGTYSGSQCVEIAEEALAKLERP